MAKSKTSYLEWARGKSIDTDGVPKQRFQCADLAKDYLRQCYDVQFSFYLSGINERCFVKSLYENFEKYPQLKGNFVKLKNTPSFIPQKGDIIVWGHCKGVTGEAGHVAISLGYSTDNTKSFRSLDQNWGERYYCAEITHNYKGVLGVIRPLQKCTIADLNVRKGPGITFAKVNEDGIKKGTLVRPLTYKNGWAQIGEGEWVSAKYLD